jgi:molybdate transport system substrate-binding protein
MEYNDRDRGFVVPTPATPSKTTTTITSAGFGGRVTQRGRRWFAARLSCVALSVMAFATPASAESVNVAVAANFTAAVKMIARAFEEARGHKAVLSFGSTGQLFTQIGQGAPFQVFLAADQARPRKALADGLAVPGSLFTYAVGKIVLFSRDPDRVTGEATLRSGRFLKIAIANPVTAPYGTAAVQSMKALKVYDTLKSRIVQGNNIAQTFQFVETGNAELGFVALSQVAGREDGSRWLVPDTLYTPIRQDAVLLKSGADNPAARAFMDFLKGPQAGAIIKKFGYGTGQ